MGSVDTQRPLVILVDGLTKRYDHLVAVANVSFSVFKGEVFGILGPNGAGKTTTIEILEGLRRPDCGKAQVNGIDVARDPQKVRAIIGVQLQTSAFFDGLTLVEILQVFGSLYRTAVDAKVLLQEVGLIEKSRSQYRELSGGQQQRFSIATALVNNPLVMFLDEPTSGLDTQARRHLWELIKRFKAQGTTIVLTTHYMEEAEELCDRVAILNGGRIVVLDSPKALIKRLLDTGFSKPQLARRANLEDVFLNLTGKQLREE